MMQVEIATNKLRQARLEKGLSQEQLAKLVGVKQQAISTYENNTRMPSMLIAKKLSQVLEKTPMDLFFS